MEAKTEPATTTLPFQVPSNNVRLKSCEQCRIAKRRCLPDNSTTAQVGEHRVCIRCKHLGITCVFSKNSTKSKKFQDLVAANGGNSIIKKQKPTVGRKRLRSTSEGPQPSETEASTIEQPMSPPSASPINEHLVADPCVEAKPELLNPPQNVIPQQHFTLPPKSTSAHQYAHSPPRHHFLPPPITVPSQPVPLIPHHLQQEPQDPLSLLAYVADSAAAAIPTYSYNQHSMHPLSSQHQHPHGTHQQQEVEVQVTSAASAVPSVYASTESVTPPLNNYGGEWPQQPPSVWQKSANEESFLQ